MPVTASILLLRLLTFENISVALFNPPSILLNPRVFENLSQIPLSLAFLISLFVAGVAGIALLRLPNTVSGDSFDELIFGANN
jgi:hypothetical protein